VHITGSVLTLGSVSSVWLHALRTGTGRGQSKLKKLLGLDDVARPRRDTLQLRTTQEERRAIMFVVSSNELR
jgi:hypothetical protein